MYLTELTTEEINSLMEFPLLCKVCSKPLILQLKNANNADMRDTVQYAGEYMHKECMNEINQSLSDMDKIIS